MKKHGLSNITSHVIYYYTAANGTILATFPSREARDKAMPEVCVAGSMPSSEPVTFGLAEKFADLPQFEKVVAHLNHC